MQDRARLHATACHWTRNYGPFGETHQESQPVWVCEYPYRTLRLDRPAPEECSDCPLSNSCANVSTASSRVLPSVRPRMASMGLVLPFNRSTRGQF